MALAVVMRAMVDGIQTSAVFCEVLTQAVVQSEQIGFRIQSESDAALVGDDDHGAPGAVQPGDGRLDSGQQLELFPGGYEAAVGGIAVQHSVPIQENEINILEIANPLRAHQDYNFKQ